MTTHHAAFWMDHNELRALSLAAEGSSYEKLAHVHAHDGHTHPKKYDGHRHGPDAKFFAAVEALLAKCEAVALFGPSLAKDEFLTHLETTKSPLRARIVAHTALDRVTDGELAAAGRKALHAADRMKGIHVDN